MTGQQDAVLDRLDEVMAEAALLPAGQRVRVLDIAVSRLQAAEADALRALETSSELAGSGCKTTRSWARLHLRRGVGAHRIVTRGRLLVDVPGFAAAFAAGDVTDEHVDALARWVTPCGIDAIQTHESTLLTLARCASARELETALEALADLANPDRDADKVTALAGRMIKIAALGELVHVDAMVEPALGEALKTAVEAGAVLPKGISRADDGRTLAQRRADAFGEIAMAGIAAQTTGPSDGTSDATSDATSDGSGASGGTSGSGGRPRRGRLRAQIAATVPTEYLAGMPGAPKPLLAHFGLIPSATAHRLVCDGDLTRVILDTATGKPLNVGRRHRLAVARQVRALGVAFRHCAFPGCEVPFRFTEIHHRDWWCRDNGATDLDLLLPYCWTHHHFVHEYGFTVTKHHGQLVHRRPDGRTIPGPDQFLRAAVTQLSIDTATTRNATDSTDSTTTGTGTSTGTGTGTTEKADRPANTSADPPDESRDPPSAA